MRTRARGRLLILGAILIVVPEPITTVVGIIMVCLSVIVPLIRKRHRLANASGVIVRNGCLAAH